MCVTEKDTVKSVESKHYLVGMFPTSQYFVLFSALPEVQRRFIITKENCKSVPVFCREESKTGAAQTSKDSRQVRLKNEVTQGSRRVTCV